MQIWPCQGRNKIMRSNFALLCGTALAALATAAFSPGLALAADDGVSSASSGPSTLAEVVVTARRANESLQKVPVAVTVIGDSALNSSGAFTPQDLASYTPGLSVSASVGDRNNVAYTIRGQGFAYGSLFPAVITYLDEVPIAHLATGQFFDLQNIPVLRGPQGVLFGRVTDGGNVMLTSKRPTNRFEGYIEAKVGDYGLHDFTGALNVPIIEDKLLVRVAADVNQRDGYTKNIATGQNLDDVAYESYRLNVIARPFDKVENYLSVSYQHTHDHGTSNVLANLNPTAVSANTGAFALVPGAFGIDPQGNVRPMAAGYTPLTGAAYVASLQKQLAIQQGLGPRTVDQSDPTYDRLDNLYVANATTWSISDSLELKNILGYNREKTTEAQNFGGSNGAAVLTCDSACGPGSLPASDREQVSEELRVAGKSFGKKLSWSIGLYADYQGPSGKYETNGVNLAILQRDTVNYNTTHSVAVFAQGEYDASNLLPGLKLNAGIRQTQDRVRDSQATYLAPVSAPGVVPALQAVLPYVLPAGTPAAVVAYVANATVAPIPHGVCQDYGAGSVFGSTTCVKYSAMFNATTGTVGATYEFPTGQLIYAKVSRGYRPGGVNSTAPQGTIASYQPEFDTSAEVGLKADWNIEGMKARTNVAVFHDDYSKIQESIVLPGKVPTSIVSNVDDAVIQGLEFEGTILPARGLTIGVDAAFTDAEYNHNTLGTIPACDPTAASISGFCSYNKFANTPKVQYGVSVDYLLPLSSSVGDVSVGGHYSYQSQQTFSTTSLLNPNSTEPGHGVLDLSANWKGVYGMPVDLAAFVTNATDKLYRTGTNDLMQRSSLGLLTNIYAPPRMFGVSAKYHF